MNHFALRQFRLFTKLAVLALTLTTLNVIAGVERAEAESVISQLGDDIDGEATSDLSGYSVALSSDGTIVAIGARENDGAGDKSGHVRVYQYDSGSWTQLGDDIDGEAGSLSGSSVSLSSDGTIVAIGAIWAASKKGHVRVYQYSGGSWTKLGDDIDGEAEDDYSGESVSLSSDGTRVAIGATQNDGANGTDSGHVRVYGYDGVDGDEDGIDKWTQIGGDLDGEAVSDFSGRSVSLSADGTRVAIGADGNNGANGTDSGHVRVYGYDGVDGDGDGINKWTQLGGDIDGEAAFDGSGQSVSLSSDGTRVAIGARDNDGGGTDSGHVRVYQYDSGSWTQIGGDIDGEAATDQSGRSVSLSADGTRVAIGAAANDGGGTSSGHVRVYQYDSGSSTWTQIGEDIDGEAADDYSGSRVALSSNGARLAIGAYGNDGNGRGAGHVRVFSISSTPSSTSSTSSTAREDAGTPGIFLTVHGRSGITLSGTQVQFGAYAIQPGSPYIVSIREENNLSSQRVLASGRATSGGHLDESLALPNLPAGSHTVVFSAYNTAGARLILGNTITVDSTGTITTVSPENLQPTIR